MYYLLIQRGADVTILLNIKNGTLRSTEYILLNSHICLVTGHVELMKISAEQETSWVYLRLLF